jgi:serine protease Do
VGVISAKGRTLAGMGRNSYSDLIQTDASINPGNSGGPLVNIDGEVVGINVAIASAPGAMGNIGIGFAIPANTAKEVMQQLIEKGKVTRGWLGVQTALGNRELPQELKEHYGVQNGALVEDVVPNSPAQKSGLKPEDVIVRFGDRQVRNFTDLENAVGTTRPNTRVQVTIVRDRKEMTIPVTLDERLPEDQVARLARGGQGGPGQGEEQARPEPMVGKFGLTVQQPSDASVKGVEVVAVAPGSPAEDAGIRAGDVIEKVGRTEVKSLAEYRKAIDAAPEREALILRVRAQSGSTGIRVLRP